MDIEKLLYPMTEPHVSGMLKVSGLHSIYFEVSGNPKGKAVLSIHGGPGSGSKPRYRTLFNPADYRIIMFDQRGCGKSTPLCEFRENDTFNLVADMEKLRKLLEIDKWLLFGGSWGSTLALTYACCHAENTAGLIVFGVFTCRKSELNWLYQEGGAANVFPEYYKDFQKRIPKGERGDMVKAYYKRLTTGSEEEKHACAKAWASWECSCENFVINDESIKNCDSDWALTRARHECHYFANRGFFHQRWPSDDALLDQACRLANIPGYILQSRYDMICPIRTAYQLHQSWPKANFIVVPDSGHSPTQFDAMKTIIDAIEAFNKNNDW